MSDILVEASPAETRLALIEQGRVVELAVARPWQAEGGVYLGRVVGVNRGLKAAFVDVGLARPGFLPDATVGEGDSVLVQALADPLRDKGARLTQAVSLPGRTIVYSPLRPGVAVSRSIKDMDARERLQALGRALAQPGEGLVLRTSAAEAGNEAVAAEVASLRALWAQIRAAADSARAPSCLLRPDPLARMLADNPGVSRILVDDDAAFAAIRARWPDLARRHRDGPVLALYDAADVLAQAVEPEVPLPGGGRLVIEQTTALVAIDVDGGGRPPQEANLDAVAEVARQLRLRNLAGHIVVDIIPTRSRDHTARLVEAMRAAVASDPVATEVVGTSALGLLELTRQRRRASLAETLTECVWRPTAETLAAEALRAVVTSARTATRPLCVVAAPGVIEALRRQPAALAETERRLGRPLPLRAEAGLSGFDVVDSEG